MQDFPTTDYDQARLNAIQYAVAARQPDATDIGHRDKLAELRECYATKRKQPRQTLIEFCCDANYNMGNLAPEGTKVIRLTKDVDMTSEEGYRLAREAIKLASPM